MVLMRSRWLVVAIAALLLTPAGVVMAQGGDDADESDDEDEFQDEGNENATDEASEDGDEEADDDDDDDDGPPFGDDRPSKDAQTRSEWEEDEGTYTGEHLRVTVDGEMPGLLDVSYLDPEAPVFASVQLHGDNLTHHARGNVIVGETDENEFTVRDDDGGQLSLEGDDDAALTIEIADGVEVNESGTDSDDDEDESAYQLHLAEDRTAWLHGEELTYDNGTFTLLDDARVSSTFPPVEHDEDDERGPPRGAGSQWDRTNASYEGEHVAFGHEEGNASITDYTIHGEHLIFAEAGLSGADETDWRAHGKHFEIRQDDARLRILDIPPAVLEIRGDEESPAHLVIADGVEVNETDRVDDDDDDEDEDDDDERRVFELRFGENRTAWLSGEELNVTDDHVTVHDRALFRAMPSHPGASPNQGPGSMPDAAESPDDDDDDDEGPPGHARAHRMDEASHAKVEHAKAIGQVGVEVHVGDSEEPVSIEMGDVRVNQVWAESEDGVRAGMQIEAPDDTPGTTVTMDLDEAGLEGVNVSEVADELAVAYDNETIAMADDLDDVLDPADDEGEPEYLLMVGNDGIQVLVSVPHFSPHTIEVYQTQSSGEQLDGSEVPGFGAVGVILATGLASLAAARKHV